MGDRYNQVPLLTQDTTWESYKTQENITYKNTRELSPLSVATHKAAMNRQNSMTDTKHK